MTSRIVFIVYVYSASGLLPLNALTRLVFTMPMPMFSLLQAPVVYSCVAGVEAGRGIGGREKGRGVGKRVPFPFCDASDFAIRRNSS